MPCKACQHFYNAMPCEYIEDKDNFFFEPIKPNIFYGYILQKGFDLLKEDCPCINCLVKIVCEKTCPEFKKTITDKQGTK